MFSAQTDLMKKNCPRRRRRREKNVAAALWQIYCTTIESGKFLILSHETRSELLYDISIFFFCWCNTSRWLSRGGLKKWTAVTDWMGKHFSCPRGPSPLIYRFGNLKFQAPCTRSHWFNAPRTFDPFVQAIIINNKCAHRPLPKSS